MIDSDKLTQDFNSYVKLRDKLKSIKQQKHDLYMEHIVEIDNGLIDYYENIHDHKSCDKLFEKHPNLKTYLCLEEIEKEFENRLKTQTISKELLFLGKSVIYKLDTSITIFDIEHNKKYNLPITNPSILRYIENNLKSLKRFIGYANNGENSVLRVIYNEVMLDAKTLSLSDDKICSIIGAELAMARMYDGSYIMYNQDNEVYNFDQECAELNKLHSEGKITDQEYYEKFYYYFILCKGNLTETFMLSDLEKRNYMVNAYLKLSQYHHGSKKVRVRTTSEVINNEVLERIKKSDANK